MIASPDTARLFPVAVPNHSTSAVLVLHGGNDQSRRPVRSRDPAVLRLRPVAGSIARHMPRAAVYRLQYAVRGWNGDGGTALRDTRWALAELRQRHPGRPIVLVGHSMGGRVALRLGGEPEVAGVVALTQWSPAGDPADHLAGVPVRVIQGAADHTCPVRDTEAWMAAAARAGARLDRTVLPRLGHPMLRRFWVWHRLTWQGVQHVLARATRLTPET